MRSNTLLRTGRDSCGGKFSNGDRLHFSFHPPVVDKVVPYTEMYKALKIAKISRLVNDINAILL